MKSKRPPQPEQYTFSWFAPGKPADSSPAIPTEPINCEIEHSTEEHPRCYPPSHPWHYLHEGDNLPPVAVDAIPASGGAGCFMERALPKNPAKREAKLRKMLDDARRELAADKARYQDIAARGADALSDYDRMIAYDGNLDLARAEALALKYNHVALGLGRIAWLEAELLRYPPRLP